MAEHERPTLSELEAAGLYDPHASDAESRLALIDYLVELGATLEDLLAENAEELPALPLTIGLWHDRERFTVSEAAARAGVDERQLRRVWRAAGSVDPPADARVVTQGDVEMFRNLNAAIDFFNEDAILQFVRVLGAAAERVADAAVSSFLVNVASASLQSDPSGLELARANQASLALVPGVVQAFDMLFRHRLEAERRPMSADTTRGVEVRRRSVGFVDLVASTALTHQLDMVALSGALSDFDATSSEIVAASGGRVVKLIGDEIMFVASEPAMAVEAALRLVDAFAAHAVLPEVRGAVASGDMLSRDGDYSGAVVNLAARAAKMAEPSSILVDGPTGVALEGAYALGPAREFVLKGFAERVLLQDVTRAR